MTRISSEEALLDAAMASPEMAPFAMFNIDLTAIVDPTTGQPVFPELATTSKEPVWLWEIRSNGGNAVDHAREDNQHEAKTHQQRVKMMARRVASGNPALEGENMADAIPLDELDDTPEDEWQRFWGGESPTEKGCVPTTHHPHHPQRGVLQRLTFTSPHGGE